MKLFAGNRRPTGALLLLVVLSLSLLAWGCGTDATAGDQQTASRLLMDTRVDLTLYGISKKDFQEAAGQVFGEMERLENILSRTVAAGDLDRINRAAGKEWVEVSPEVFFVLEQALEFAGQTGGAFDPTVAPLLDLWGFGTGEQGVPSGEELQRVLPLVDYRLVELDKSNFMVYLPREGMKLDLGGIAKGFIVDRGQEKVRDFGPQASFINAGGDINLYGAKPSGEKWVVGVQNPADPQKLLAYLYLEGGVSVATSGDYQRYFEENGEKYHHILDPADGMPARHLTSVTIVAADAMTADAFSTAVFVLGREKGLELLESLPATEGILVDKEGEVYYTSGLEGMIKVNGREWEAD